MGRTYVTLCIEGSEDEAKGLIEAVHKTGQASVISRTYTEAPVVEESLSVEQARALADEDGYVSVVVEADLIDMMEQHKYQDSGGDDESDHLHGIAFTGGTTYASGWEVLGNDGSTALVLYTTSLEGMAG